MAGVAGLEPTNDGIKTRCLTTWLYPNNVLQMVRKERLELSRREALEPKSSVSTNSTTPASGVGDGARTRDNRNHNPGLYQLSYAHHNKLQLFETFYFLNDFLTFELIVCALKDSNQMVVPEGFEPSTHALEGRCSIQLSYGT